jgi:hypothetical protein
VLFLQEILEAGEARCARESRRGAKCRRDGTLYLIFERGVGAGINKGLQI